MKKKLYNTEVEQIVFEYVKLLLEVKYGCRVEQMGTGDSSSSMEVWSPKGYNKSSIQVNVDSAEEKEVAVLIARIINGRKVPVITDYHILKFVGKDGVYCLEEEKLQQLLMENLGRVETSEDGKSLFTLFPKQLLLDHCNFIAA